ncbi:MAG: hypothetical protein ABJC13_20565 [Acidobacteriota bacterium]
MSQPPSISCRICDQGQLFHSKVHRLSGPAVTIGYILLVPSLLGILLSLFFLMASWVGAASTATELSAVTREAIRTADVPLDLRQKLEQGHLVTESEMANLTFVQRSAIESANSQLAASVAGSGCAAACGTGLAGIGAVFSFVGGLVGWLLVMKKRVLKCNLCGAAVAVS